MPRKKDGFSYSRTQLQEIAQEVLDYARHRGATACETDVSEGFGHSVTVRRGEVETIEYNRDKGLGVSVYIGQRRGHASSSDFSRAAIRAAVDAALSIASFTAEDNCAGLADETLLWHGPSSFTDDLQLYHPWTLPIEGAVELARRCEAAAFAVSPEIRNSEGASAARQESQFISGNSNGFLDGFSTSRHSISCSVIAGEGEDMQRDDWYSSRRDADQLAAPEEIGDYAARRALSRLGARRVATCAVPVIFEAPLACGLLGSFVNAVSGGSLYRKSSFLLDTIGQEIFAPHISITENPHLPGAQSSTPYDDEGVATAPRDVVKNGVLQGYFLGSYSARKLGMQTTGNAGGSHNLILAAGQQSFAELVGSVSRGLLVTELLGQGVNYVTGDYSRGAAGYWIENGVIQYPVQEITIAGNMRDMFRNIVALGNDVIVRGGKQAPSMLIEGMTVAGA
ncbi:MAG: pmbA [Rhodocyclales bacterium]|nr:pmbA [Rhodocyclales bacterium]